MKPRCVAGVDGCRAGWLVVLRPLDAPAPLEVRLVATFAEVLDLPEAPEVIAIDVPIGLPSVGTVGGREADAQARSVLGLRQSSVFAVPARAAIMETDYRTACEIALRHSVPPRMVSKQTFNIFPKIREVDRLMTPSVQVRVKEVHPEVAFWALNDEHPLAEPKKVKSKVYPPGLALRIGLLSSQGYPPDLLERHRFGSRAGADDVLDAAANSWSAVRIAQGTARRFPAAPPTDQRGLSMEIWG